MQQDHQHKKNATVCIFTNQKHQSIKVIRIYKNKTAIQINITYSHTHNNQAFTI